MIRHPVVGCRAEQLVQTGIYDLCDWVQIGWDDTGEVDEVRGFGEISQPTPTAVLRDSTEAAQGRPTASGRVAVQGRPMRLYDAHQSIGQLYKAALAAYGDSKPIGLLRGSIWHAQRIRRNWPLFDKETHTQTNDVNQISNSQATAMGFGGTYPQHEALYFACDVMRGSGASFMTMECDRQDSNMRIMQPPGITDPTLFDSLLFQNEIKNRAANIYKRGINMMVTHWTYGQLQSWAANFSQIRADFPITQLNPQPVYTFSVPGPDTESVVLDNDCIKDAITKWRTLGGGATVSQPIRFVLT